MAHQLNFNEQTGQYSYFSVKEIAWHGLGQIVQEHPTSAEAMQLAGLDYEVIKTPLYTKNDRIAISSSGETIWGEEIEVPAAYATLRTDNNNVLGVVGKDYEIVQNRDAFSFFDSIVGSGKGVRYETAGALGKGERIFITAKLDDDIKVGSNDYIGKYLFLTTSHDGSGSITAAFTPIRIVCANTLSAALGKMTGAVRIRHTANAKERLENAHKIMGIACDMGEQLETIFNQWAKVRITDNEVKKLIQLALAPNKEVYNSLSIGEETELSTKFKNTCDDVFEYAMTSDTQLLETTKGTVFGAYNAVTGYFQNVCEYDNSEAKVKSILLGGNAQKRTQIAFDLCDQYTRKGNGIFQLN
ncbi:DUF932 domain-containing protein [Taibaiella koreensis]|uniref:DUF932 domain-containing protein n=1 Tax=Taibaiella koreensis TaxID=1268548 RepID=UPI000E59FB18|nr:DUF932 domain-containing protein [Taibaiella koreensis]